MKFLSLLVLSAAGVAVAKGGDGTSTKSQCKQIEKLTHLQNIAANETLLAKASKGNATRAEAIKAKASEAATKLTTLQSNATLMAACDVIAAEQTSQRSCAQMAKWESQAALVANATKLDAKTDGNSTKADKIKAKVAANADALAAMQSNTTLTAFCSVLDVKQTCRQMSSLQKEIDTAANTTKLEAKFKGNATKVEKFQAKASKAAEKLATMQANTTLTDMCAQLKTSNGDTTGASTSGGSNSAASGATDVKPVGAMVSLAALFFASLLLL